MLLVKLQNLKNSKLVAQTNKYRPGFYEWFHFNSSIAIDQIYKWQKFCVAKPSSLFSRISVEKQFNFLNILKLKKNDKFCGKLNHDSQKIWKNISLVLMLLSKSQNKWDIFFKLWPSHNVLTLVSILVVCWLWRICISIFLVISIRLIGYLRCQQNMLLGVKFTVFLNEIEGVKIYILFFFAHTPTIKVVLYKSRENRSEIWAGFELAGSTENSDKISYFLG